MRPQDCSLTLQLQGQCFGEGPHQFHIRSLNQVYLQHLLLSLHVYASVAKVGFVQDSAEVNSNGISLDKGSQPEQTEL